MSIRKYILSILLTAMMAAGITSCKKSELQAFELPTMVHFYKEIGNYSRDSAVYSFAIYSPTLLQDTVKLPVRIAGTATDKDRQIKLRAVADSSTAIEGTDYQIHSARIRAGRFTDTILLVVRRTAEMKTKEKRLLLEIIPSDDLQPGIYNTPSGAGNNNLSGASVRMLVKINDYLTKPGNWESMLVFFFGEYSQVKYKFIIDVTGRGEFLVGGRPGEMPYGQIVAYKQMLQQALIDYNKLHGDLIDENGGIVTF